MTIMWSRIHAELGLNPCPLTYSMMTRAVDEQVAENVDLDWKQALPADVEKKRWEFAKDVAMLANTRGGLIVFGVREEDERAQELVGVPTGERHRQRLRALAHGRVRPMVDGLLIEALDDESGERGLIVVFVPPSSDAPHVVGDKNEMGIPYRDGTDTRWMTEHLLARAYRDRFNRRGDDRAALRTLVAELPDTGNGVWAFVSASPTAPAPPQFGRPDPGGVISTMRALPALAAEVAGSSYRDGPLLNHLLDSAIGNPRIGLRRWVFRSDYYSTDPHATVDWAVVELHHDGSVALGVRVDRLVPAAVSGEPPASEVEVSWVPIKLLDQLVVEAVALSALHVRSLGGVGATLIRVDLSRDAPKPMVAVDNMVGGGYVSALFGPVPGSRALQRAWDVETGYMAADDVPGLRNAARQLTDDLNHQFGIRASSVPE
ncbi:MULTISPECIES: helix-turn-helix domain-containing protein [unclassified Amycolatopsis]|uniref:AlbA family DNA-binding domain-containing protein n=1 Tax=unclassified Amycolatopsis TaxID=2618356 RepID=UPI00106E7DA0|nr:MULTISPECIES: ATP-binding protein [unclassified Amycolatopsis]